MATPSPATFLRRAFIKKNLRRCIATVTVVGLFYGMMAGIYAARVIFKVKMNYAVVLERFGGDRQAVTEVGWHAPLDVLHAVEHFLEPAGPVVVWIGDTLVSAIAGLALGLVIVGIALVIGKAFGKNLSFSEGHAAAAEH